MNIDFNYNNPQIKDYVIGLTNDVIKIPSYVACLFIGKIIILQDNAILYIIDISDKVPKEAAFMFEKGIEIKDGYIFDTLATTRDNMNNYTSLVLKFEDTMAIKMISPIIYVNNDLKSDPSFQDYLNLKTVDGVKKFFIKTTDSHPFIPVLAGFPNLNKQDGIGILLYDIGNHKILVQEQIYKQKLKINYDIYYRIIDVNRPLR